MQPNLDIRIENLYQTLFLLPHQRFLHLNQWCSGGQPRLHGGLFLHHFFKGALFQLLSLVGGVPSDSSQSTDHTSTEVEAHPVGMASKVEISLASVVSQLIDTHLSMSIQEHKILGRFLRLTLSMNFGEQGQTTVLKVGTLYAIIINIRVILVGPVITFFNLLMGSVELQ